MLLLILSKHPYRLPAIPIQKSFLEATFKNLEKNLEMKTWNTSVELCGIHGSSHLRYLENIIVARFFKDVIKKRSVNLVSSNPQKPIWYCWNCLENPWKVHVKENHFQWSCTSTIVSKAVIPHSAKTCRTLILAPLGSLGTLEHISEKFLRNFSWWKACRSDKTIPEVDSGTLSSLKLSSLQ